jgi:hypothetical protein
MATVPELITALEAKVTETEGVAASAKVLIAEFAKFVAANKADPVALQAYVDRLTASNAGLADAVAANPDPDTAD